MLFTANGSFYFEAQTKRDKTRGSTLQIRCDFGELGEGGLEVFNDFCGDGVGVAEIGAVFEAFIFEPEDVEVEFVALG